MNWPLLIPLSIAAINALVINELQNWSLPAVKRLIDNPEREFLDVDVSSDFVDTAVTLKSVAEPPTASGKVYKFYDLKGNNFQCALSYPAAEVLVKKGVNFETIKQILLKRSKSCYYYKSTNWIYEYCHMKATRQVNRNKIKGVHQEISLGRYYPPQFSLKMEADLNFVKATFDDGKYCPLKGAARVSHVKYVCANEKPTMYVVDVVEAPVCEYNFIVHVPELCEFFDKHAKSVKKQATISCYSASDTASAEKPRSKKSTSSANSPIEGLDKMLELIESQYKDSALLLQYKDLLRKASERLKADDLGRKLGEENESLSELIKVFFPKSPSSEETIEEPTDEDHKGK